MNFHEKCKQIYNQSREQPVAVYNVQGNVHFCPANTPQHEPMRIDFERYLVGIYNAKCTLKMIQEDLL